jgi:hypothetical protein
MSDSLSNALAWFASIKEMVETVDQTEGELIRQSVLSVEVRSGWHTPEAINDRPPEEYRILLTTGGPGLQLTGSLDESGQPETAELQHQDWGTPWTRVALQALADPAAMADDIVAACDKAQAYLLTFAQQFYFGEG